MPWSKKVGANKHHEKFVVWNLKRALSPATGAKSHAADPPTCKGLPRIVRAACFGSDEATHPFSRVFGYVREKKFNPTPSSPTPPRPKPFAAEKRVQRRTFDFVAAELSFLLQLGHLILEEGQAPLPGDGFHPEPLRAVLHAATHSDAVLERVGSEEVQEGLVGHLLTKTGHPSARTSNQICACGGIELRVPNKATVFHFIAGYHRRQLR